MCVCIDVYYVRVLCACLGKSEAKEEVGHLEHLLQDGHWEPNSGPLKLQVLLSTEPSLLLHILTFIKVANIGLGQE